MQLQSIKLQNFRQFREGEISFASGKNGKNVTIILGENGTGKTTFAQAFFWCLYGDTSFQDKVILNRITANQLEPGQKARVEVQLKLRHMENSYTISRYQDYVKDSTGKVKGQNTVQEILKMDKGGNTQPVKATMQESEIRDILPQELSKYFFFDGERIDQMSKDIIGHKKSAEFTNAVKSLLGLKGMERAIYHLGSGKGVIAQYEKLYDAGSNSKFAEYTKIIADCDQKLEQLTGRLEEIDRQQDMAEARRIQKSEELKQYEEGEKWQNIRESLQKRIAQARSSQLSMVKSTAGSFLGGVDSLLSVAMIQKAMLLLKEQDFSGKDIPHMHEDTVNYLLNQGVCICGTQLTEGSLAYQRLKDLIAFLPPKSLSSTIGDFRKAAMRRVSNAQQKDLLETVGDNLAIINEQEDEITNCNDELHKVDEKLSGEDVQAKVKAINGEIKHCNDIIQQCKKNHDACIAAQTTASETRKDAVAKRKELALADEKNKKNELYKTYAEAVFQSISEYYHASEKTVRDALQETINNLFLQIYEGGLSLTIDDNYRITVFSSELVNDKNNVETSTAQSISVIFAFIAGIIKMQRENRYSEDEDTKLLSSEPYPLVMDAPLSAFDKKRIKAICDTLPNIAEQVVIFIKDTDGDLAEEYLGDRIGSRHWFEKDGEFVTHLM